MCWTHVHLVIMMILTGDDVDVCVLCRTKADPRTLSKCKKVSYCVDYAGTHLCDNVTLVESFISGSFVVCKHLIDTLAQVIHQLPLLLSTLNVFLTWGTTRHDWVRERLVQKGQCTMSWRKRHCAVLGHLTNGRCFG